MNYEPFTSSGIAEAISNIHPDHDPDAVKRQVRLMADTRALPLLGKFRGGRGRVRVYPPQSCLIAGILYELSGALPIALLKDASDLLISQCKAQFGMDDILEAYKSGKYKGVVMSVIRANEGSGISSLTLVNALPSDLPSEPMLTISVAPLVKMLEL